jgi:hypothetical protein
MGITLRDGWIGTAVIFGAIALAACSGKAGEAGSGESTGEDRSLLKEGACLSESMGGTTSCKSPDDWKTAAADACASRGLELAELTLGTACKDGNVDAKYSCCKTGPKPSDGTTDPGSGGDTNACFTDAQGGPTSCKTDVTWKEYASELCAAKGATLTAIGFAEDCGGHSYRWAKYECCGDAIAPPVDGKEPSDPGDTGAASCTTHALGGTTCNTEAAWKGAAAEVCAKEGLVLTEIGYGATCAKAGTVSEVKFNCCK